MLTDHLWILLISLAGFLALWPVSLLKRDSSIVDFWWGPGIGAMAAALWFANGAPTGGATLAVLTPLMLWSLRLGLHLGVRRLREGTEDPRYTELRGKFSPGWWWKSLFIVFILQSVLQIFVGIGGLAGLAAAMRSDASPMIAALSVIAVSAVAMQFLSDLQLDRYRAKVPHGGLLKTGLRAYVRYPSYTAEITFWLSISAQAVILGVWWAPASAILIAFLLRYISGVAVLEDRMARTRPEFETYRSNVPALIPNFPRPDRRNAA